MLKCDCGNIISNNGTICSSCRYPSGIRKCGKCKLEKFCDKSRSYCKECCLEQKLNKYKKEIKVCNKCKNLEQFSKGNTLCNKCILEYKRNKK